MSTKYNNLYTIQPVSFFSSNNEESPLYTQSTNFSLENWHNHDVYEIVYISEGEFLHKVNDIKADLVAGDVICLRPSDIHSFFPGKTGIHRDLVFEKNFFKEVCQAFNEELFKTYHSSLLPIKIHVSENTLLHLESLCLEYSQLAPKNKDVKIMYSKIILHEILSLIFRENLAKMKNEQYPPLITQILNRFHMPALYKAGLAVILEPFNYNKSYICRLFKRTVGVTMTDYLNEHRLNFVANQLKLSSKSITIICNEAGFSSMPYFNKLFTKKYGMTPLKYRKSFR